jgi:hypothetical protein
MNQNANAKPGQIMTDVAPGGTGQHEKGAIRRIFLTQAAQAIFAASSTKDEAAAVEAYDGAEVLYREAAKRGYQP